MKEKKLIYIGVPSSSVFDSQVIGLIQEIKTRFFFNRIILLAGVKNNNDWNKILSELEITGVETLLFKKYPNYHFYKMKQVKELRKVLDRVLSDNTVIHIRGESLSLVVRNIINNLKYNNVKILTDIRGSSYEETQIYNKLKPIFFQLKLYQHNKNLRLIEKNSDYISCVSEKLKEYVLKRSKINKDKVYINHCIAGNSFKFSNEIRVKYRIKLGVKDDDTLFLFVTGGGGKWQNTIEIVNSIVKKGYKVLNLSRNIIQSENVINLFVPHKEVSNYLNAADISIVWRNNDVVNNVASPVKFSEYVCCGLPVLANNGVSLINKYIEKTGYGKTINSFEEINSSEIKKFMSLNRREISNYAVQHFSAEVITNNYISIYDKLLN